MSTLDTTAYRVFVTAYRALPAETYRLPRLHAATPNTEPPIGIWRMTQVTSSADAEELLTTAYRGFSRRHYLIPRPSRRTIPRTAIPQLTQPPTACFWFGNTAHRTLVR